MWWETNKSTYPQIKELVINLDNGPNAASGRTQFIRRMTEFADKTGLRIRLVYYPPYHSKYNSIERCWGILEEHWNGEILDSIDKAINWARTMTWKGIKPVVHLFLNHLPQAFTPLAAGQFPDFILKPFNAFGMNPDFGLSTHLKICES